MRSPAFMFATGIENSSPTIEHGRRRIAKWRAAGTISAGATAGTQDETPTSPANVEEGGRR